MVLTMWGYTEEFGHLGRMMLPPAGIKTAASDVIRIETFNGYKAVHPNVRTPFVFAQDFVSMLLHGTGRWARRKWGEAQPKKGRFGCTFDSAFKCPLWLAR